MLLEGAFRISDDEKGLLIAGQLRATDFKIATCQRGTLVGIQVVGIKV